MMVDSPLPDWETKTLGELTEKFLNGGTPSTGVPEYWNGHIPWLTGADAEQKITVSGRQYITDKGVRESSTSVVPRGNILLVTRTGVGKVSIAGVDVAISQDLTGIIPRQDCVDTEYLYWQLKHRASERSRLAQGTIILGIQREKVAALEIPTPPLPEQRKIARILSAVDDLIERTEALIAKYRAIKQGLMHDLLTRGVDASGRLRPPREEAPGLYRESAVGWVPKDWEVVQLGSLIAYGPQNGIYKPEHAYGSEGTRIVRIDGFYNGLLVDQQSLRRVKLSSPDQVRYALDTNDIMINRVNSIDYVGKSAIVPALAEQTVFESNIMRLKVCTDRILPQFAARSLLWVNNRQQLRRRAKSAIAQASVNQQDVRVLILALPELTEQEHIVALLLAQDVAISRETQTYHKLTAVRAGLMQDLLTGRVRVKADTQAERPA